MLPIGCARAVAALAANRTDFDGRRMARTNAVLLRGASNKSKEHAANENRDAVEVLAALAQGTRLAIFRLLVQQGPEGLPVGEIAERLELAGATLSFHLKELAHAELVSPRQAGRFIYYSANYRTMNGLIDYLTRNCCQGATCDIACAPAAKRNRGTI
jgi:DNA-binding transcriptional ArsR family regulator